MGIIREYFNKKRANSLLKEYEGLLREDTGVDAIRYAISMIESNTEVAFAQFVYFYQLEKNERSAVNLISMYNYCRFNNVFTTISDRYESVVEDAVNSMVQAIGIGDTKYSRGFQSVTEYLLIKDKISKATKVLDKYSKTNAVIEYLRAVVDMHNNDVKNSIARIAPVIDDEALPVMAKILYCTALTDTGEDVIAREILKGINYSSASPEGRSEAVCLMYRLGLYKEALDIITSENPPSEYDIYVAVKCSNASSIPLNEQILANSDCIDICRQFAEAEGIMSIVEYNGTRASILIENLKNDRLYDTGTSAFRAMREGELIEQLAKYVSYVRYLTFLFTFIV